MVVESVKKLRISSLKFSKAMPVIPAVAAAAYPFRRKNNASSNA